MQCPFCGTHVNDGFYMCGVCKAEYKRHTGAGWQLLIVVALFIVVFGSLIFGALVGSFFLGLIMAIVGGALLVMLGRSNFVSPYKWVKGTIRVAFNRP